MTRWYLYLICGALLIGGLLGCSEEPAQQQPAKSNAAVKTPPASKAPVPEPVVEEEVKEFVYSSEGRRDPFVPLTAIRGPVVQSDEPVTPLQTFDLNQFRLVGVIVGKGEPKAMVVAPDGKSYVLSKGTKVGKNNGVVIDIDSEVILVEEKYYDFSGNIIENIQEITVPKREGV